MSSPLFRFFIPFPPFPFLRPHINPSSSSASDRESDKMKMTINLCHIIFSSVKSVEESVKGRWASGMLGMKWRPWDWDRELMMKRRRRIRKKRKCWNIIFHSAYGAGRLSWCDLVVAQACVARQNFIAESSFLAPAAPGPHRWFSLGREERINLWKDCKWKFIQYIKVKEKVYFFFIFVTKQTQINIKSDIDKNPKEK